MNTIFRKSAFKSVVSAAVTAVLALAGAISVGAPANASTIDFNYNRDLVAGGSTTIVQVNHIGEENKKATLSVIAGDCSIAVNTATTWLLTAGATADPSLCQVRVVVRDSHGRTVGQPYTLSGFGVPPVTVDPGHGDGSDEGDESPIVLTPDVPAYGYVDLPYSYTIGHTGCTPTVWTYTVTSGTIPAGITFENGVVSGTATEPGSFTISVTASHPEGEESDSDGSHDSTPDTSSTPSTTSESGSGDGSHDGSGDGTDEGDDDGEDECGSDTQSYDFVFKGVIDLKDQTPPNATKDSPYNFELPKSGCTPTSWSYTGTLINDLVFANGVVSGTPKSTGTFTIVVTASADGCVSDTQSYTFTIDGPDAIVLNETQPGDKKVGTPFSFTILTSGCTPSAWTVDTNNLPAGVTFSNGVISGTPTVSGTFSITVTATNTEDGCTPDTFTYSFRVDVADPGPTGDAIDLLPETPAPGNQNEPYNWSVPHSGCTPTAYSYVGTLLPDLVFSNGVVSGTPTVQGTFTITVTATGDGCIPDTQDYTFTIGEAPIKIITPTLPGGTLNTPYSGPIAAVGGCEPYTWSLSGGALPAGLSLDPATGVISGTPTESGSFPIEVTVVGCSTDKHNYTIKIGDDNVKITTPNLPGGNQNEPYKAPLDAAGGCTPYEWSLESGSLPVGLVVTADGFIQGTPTNPGTYNFTIRVVGCSTDLKAFSIVVGEAAAPTTTVIKATGSTVYFKGDSSVLSAEAKKTLKRMFNSILKGYKKAKVNIIGYVYPTADTSYDAELSAARAKKVAAYLRSLGLKATFSTYGEKQPLEADPKSRRSDIDVVYEVNQ